MHAPTIPPRLPHMAVVVAPDDLRARALSRSSPRATITSRGRVRTPDGDDRRVRTSALVIERQTVGPDRMDQVLAWLSREVRLCHRSCYSTPDSIAIPMARRARPEANRACSPRRGRPMDRPKDDPPERQTTENAPANRVVASGWTPATPAPMPDPTLFSDSARPSTSASRYDRRSLRACRPTTWEPGQTCEPIWTRSAATDARTVAAPTAMIITEPSDAAAEAGTILDNARPEDIAAAVAVIVAAAMIKFGIASTRTPRTPNATPIPRLSTFATVAIRTTGSNPPFMSSEADFGVGQRETGRDSARRRSLAIPLPGRHHAHTSHVPRRPTSGGGRPLATPVDHRGAGQCAGRHAARPCQSR
jgi:hypothetical protein